MLRRKEMVNRKLDSYQTEAETCFSFRLVILLFSFHAYSVQKLNVKFKTKNVRSYTTLSNLAYYTLCLTF